MYIMKNDYNHGAHPTILEALMATNDQSFNGYGLDPMCEKAEAEIKKYLDCPNAHVHFLLGGTQTNFTLIAAALKPFQSVICADCGHVNGHETGAVENTGHKLLIQPNTNGKLRAEQVRKEAATYANCDCQEHVTQPKLVYLSFPTAFGTLYSKQELLDIKAACDEYGLLLFIDGARMSYGLAAPENDVTLADLAAVADAFYLGGTKCGTLFGEALVLTKEWLHQDFRAYMKQNGAMLAKGWLLGLQYEALMENDLYLQIAAHADTMADKIRATLSELNYPLLVEGVTNQIFPILPDDLLDKLKEDFTFSEQLRVDESHRAVRFCTSWATKEESVDALCDALKKLSV